MNETGLDISRHQGDQINWSKMASAEVKFIWLKCSQGTAHKDPRFEANLKSAKSFGIQAGAYHFTTNDDALKQYQWFVKCMGESDLDLAPALDCEYYQSYGAMEIEPVLAFRYDKVPLGVRLSNIIRASAITTESIVDVIGRKLTTWMADKPKLAPFGYPAIYTNVASGNKIFKSPTMARYPLWIANWHGPTVPLTKPTLPKVWKGKAWLAWQDDVIPGEPYGIPGDVDHDLWGDLFPLPGVTPPPADKTITLAGLGKDGSRWTGKLEVA